MSPDLKVKGWEGLVDDSVIAENEETEKEV